MSLQILHESDFKLWSLRRVGSFLFNMISFKLLCGLIQMTEDFSETRKELFDFTLPLHVRCCFNIEL